MKGEYNGGTAGVKNQSETRKVWLVARREIRTRTQARSFVLGTIGILVSVLAMAYVVWTVNDVQKITVGITSEAQEFGAAVEQTAGGPDSGIQFVNVDASGFPDLLEDGSVDAVIHDRAGKPIITVTQTLDPRLAAPISLALERQAYAELLDDIEVGAAEREQAFEGALPEIRVLDPEPTGQQLKLSVGLATVMLIFLSTLVFGLAVAQGVVEEKQTRVVEILLSTVKPWHLMFGKVLGIGAVGLLQLIIIVVVSLGVALFADVIPDGIEVTSALGWGIAWYILGYLLFCTVLAAAAAMVSRQEEVSSIFQPTLLLIGIPLIIGVTFVPADPANLWLQALSILPPFSPMMMPIQIALGVPLWHSLLAVTLNILAIVFLARLAGRVYANSVLRMGRRVRLSEALSR
ncbi:ABC transporter permease [Arthrobacter sp. Z1-15]